MTTGGNDSEFQEYTKKVPTWAVQLPRDAIIPTKEGELRASEGDYLALDEDGYPYPISQDTFERTYELAEDEGDN